MTLSILSRSLICFTALPRTSSCLRRQGFVTTVHRLNTRDNTKDYSQWKLLALYGFAGGAVTVAVGGYAFYHWSGLNKLVQMIQHPMRAFKGLYSQKSSDISDIDAETGTAAALLIALRQIAKAHVTVIPGAGVLVDMAFNEIEKVVETHQEEACAVLGAAFKEMQEVVRTRGEDSKEVAWAILAILRAKLGQVQALAAAGQDKIGPLFDRFPGFAKHASSHILRVRDSLLPVYQKGLEKPKNILSGLTKSTSSRSGPSSSAAEVSSCRVGQRTVKLAEEVSEREGS